MDTFTIFFLSKAANGVDEGVWKRIAGFPTNMGRKEKRKMKAVEEIVALGILARLVS